MKFQRFNSQNFLVLQATPPGTHVGLIWTFWFMLHTFFTIKVMIQGYHIYRDIWSAVIAKKLLCEKESGNIVISGKICYWVKFPPNLHVFKILKNFAPFGNVPLYDKHLTENTSTYKPCFPISNASWVDKSTKLPMYFIIKCSWHLFVVY